jgi:hypothetical protein
MSVPQWRHHVFAHEFWSVSQSRPVARFSGVPASSLTCRNLPATCLSQVLAQQHKARTIARNEDFMVDLSKEPSFAVGVLLYELAMSEHPVPGYSLDDDLEAKFGSIDEQGLLAKQSGEECVVA